MLLDEQNLHIDLIFGRNVFFFVRSKMNRALCYSEVFVGVYTNPWHNKKSRFHRPTAVENRLFGKMPWPDYPVTSYSETFNVSRYLPSSFHSLITSRYLEIN